MFGTKNPLRFAAQIGFLMPAIVHNIFLAPACLVKCRRIHSRVRVSVFLQRHRGNYSDTRMVRQQGFLEVLPSFIISERWCEEMGKILC
jgi:hypothetical protein